MVPANSAHQECEGVVQQHIGWLVSSMRSWEGGISVMSPSHEEASWAEVATAIVVLSIIAFLWLF